MLWKSDLSKKGKIIDKESKGNYLLTPEAFQLLEVPGKEKPRIKRFLLNNYKGLPVSPEIKNEFYNYFIGHSVFSAATAANPVASVITELLYEGMEKLNLSSPIDQYFLQSKAGRSIKARLEAIERELPKIIEEYHQKRKRKREILVGNLGSGPGRDVIDVLSTYYRNASDIKAIHIDKDRLALERGKRMAEIKGISHLVEFVEGSFLKYKPTRKFDIVLLIGILCPLDVETCIFVLKKVRKLLNRDGCLLASSVSKKMLKEDPFTCYLMSLGNWKMVFKDEEELKQIFQRAGYDWKRCFFDSYGFNITGIGTPHSYF